MSDRQLPTDKKLHRLQPKKESQPQTPVAQEGILLPQHDSLTQVSRRVDVAPSVEAHAAMLNRFPFQAQESLLQLQQQYGNRYVQRVIAIARQGEGKTTVAPEVETAIQQKRGKGQALDSRRRVQMESAFGTDFSGVQVHTDGEADSLNQALNARAFTTGQDIFFRQGEYNPGSSAGRGLLAHELTHVLQQRAGLQGKLTVGEPGNVYEQEADRVADQVMGMPEPKIQRVCPECEEELQRQPIKGEKEEEKEIALRPPAKDSKPTAGRILALRKWLTAHIAGYALADKTYTFYEKVDQYLGPWGESGYPIAYGKHYNLLFTTNKPLMANPVTQDWVWRTTVLLQKSLRDFIVTRYSKGTLSSLTEAELRQAAFNSHSMAYTEAGLAKVCATDPLLIFTILSIPGVEFSLASENFAATIEQVTETTVMVIPQTMGLLLAAAMPAHSGMRRTAAEIDRRKYMAEIRLNRFLGRLLEDIETDRITSIVLLEQITQKLYEQEFPNQGFAKFARQIISAANQRKKELAKHYADSIKKNPKLKPLYDQAQPGWEKWL